MEQYKLERGTVALPFYVTLNGQTVATFSNEDDANTFLEIKNAVQENTDPQKITVEDVYNEVKPCFWINAVGNIGNSMFQGEIGRFMHLPKEQHAKQVLAFCQLLTCAYWANDGEPPSSKNNFDYVRVWYDLLEKKFASSINNDVFSFPFYFKNKEAYDKFISIEGIEPLLHTFLNTGK